MTSTHSICLSERSPSPIWLPITPEIGKEENLEGCGTERVSDTKEAPAFPGHIEFLEQPDVKGRSKNCPNNCNKRRSPPDFGPEGSFFYRRRPMLAMLRGVGGPFLLWCARGWGFVARRIVWIQRQR